MADTFQFNTLLFTSDVEASFSFAILRDLLSKQQVTITDTNHPQNDSRGKVVRIALHDPSEVPPARSTEHLVFFGTMSFQDSSKQAKEVCLKFTIPKDFVGDHEDQIPERFLTYTQKHANYVLYNYNLLQTHLASFKPKTAGNVSINTVYCCQVASAGGDKGTVSFWVEDKLPHFDKFWDEGKESYIDKMLSTDVPILKELQEHIYNDSGYAYTVIDLQGLREDDAFTLCDVELSLSSLYEFTPAMILDRVITLNSWKKVTLKSIEDSVQQLKATVESRMGALEGSMEALEGSMEEIKRLLGQLVSGDRKSVV